MKRLVLLRHAKSDWSEPVSDERRPLNKRGRRARQVIARHLASLDLGIELICTSPAERARATGAPTAEVLGLAPVVDDRLYTFDMSGVLEVVRSLPDDVDAVMLVGHNPAFEDVSAHLTGEDARYTTATVGVIDLDVAHWADVTPHSGQLIQLVSARELEAST